MMARVSADVMARVEISLLVRPAFIVPISLTLAALQVVTAPYACQKEQFSGNVHSKGYRPTLVKHKTPNS